MLYHNFPPTYKMYIPLYRLWLGNESNLPDFPIKEYEVANYNFFMVIWNSPGRLTLIYCIELWILTVNIEVNFLLFACFVYFAKLPWILQMAKNWIHHSLKVLKRIQKRRTKLEGLVFLIVDMAIGDRRKLPTEMIRSYLFSVAFVLSVV